MREDAAAYRKMAARPVLNANVRLWQVGAPFDRPRV
jgi:hypothetical protein